MGLWVRYVTQLLIVISPLLSGSFSLLDFVGVKPNAAGDVSLLGLSYLSGHKDHVEFNLRLSIALLLFVVSIINEWKTVGQPLERIRAFRNRYLDDYYEKEWKTLLGDGFRINVMYLHRGVSSLGLSVFQWTWSKNYQPPHHSDANMLLFGWQGVAGQAVREARQGRHRGKAAYFESGPPKPLRAPYYLAPWQISRTWHLQGVLSVPILRKMTAKSAPGSPSFKCVGVINIDALTPEAAKKLKENEKNLTNYFAEVGLPLGDLA